VEVFVMFVDVFNFVYNPKDDLSRLKIEALKDYRAAAQKNYKEHLGYYVKDVLGHPLESLSVRKSRTLVNFDNTCLSCTGLL